MPSDPSGVHPQGVLTRPAPDFFDDNIGLGGFWRPFTTGLSSDTFITVALFNNSTQGLAFKVYGISLAADGGDGFGFYFVLGPVGSFYANCQPIRPDIGSPNGQIYTQLTVVGSGLDPNPFNPGPYANVIAGSGFDGNTVLSPFPLFVVPAGYSLVGTNVSTGGSIGCSFWYQQANE
jgi:hypothetical protein